MSYRHHWGRHAYYVVGEGIIREPLYLFGEQPHHGAHSLDFHELNLPPEPFKFGRLFSRAPELNHHQRRAMISALTRLGKAMNAEPDIEVDSVIPSGYTYFGQFLAHELTFDRTVGIPEEEIKPENFRSPKVDLDSLYGCGPEDSPELYEDDGVTLTIGTTLKNKSLNKEFPNDLLRDADGKAKIEDPRNDENLQLAQTQVAMIHFHNRVVEALKPQLPAAHLLSEARRLVRRHLQWIILHDFLPRIIDRHVLWRVLEHKYKLQFFRITKKTDVYMPLEFSAGAYRLGHSMVRDRYEWNHYHTSLNSMGAPTLGELFDQTNFSGQMKLHLLSEWVVDWRRFYDFGELCEPAPGPHNFARRIDTTFDLHLDQIPGYPTDGLELARRSITVRNLLRGFALRLPTGETVAKAIGITPIERKKLVAGPFEELLTDPIFHDETPLWYYILKEAELDEGRRLGPVGSRIIAETFVGILLHSPNSILRDPEWTPIFSRRKTASGKVRFEMADLIDFAGVTNPINA